MPEKHILCGFDVPEFEKRIKVLLKEQGYEAITYTQLSKKGVKGFLEQNPKCDTVILLEASNFKKSYTAEEIAALTDKREINVIVVLSSRHIGTDYMKTLYVAGVTNAIFQMGRKDGASAKDIVELIIQKRSRQEARKYYGIEHLDMDPTVVIDMDTYAECFERLHKDDHLLVNYLKICADMSPKKIAEFTKRMPSEDREYLAQYAEFHMLMDAIRSLGAEIKIKRPRKTKVGMKVTPQIQINSESVSYMNHEELFHMPEKKPVVNGDEKEAVDETVLSDKRLIGLSMEELLKAVQSDDSLLDSGRQEPVDLGKTDLISNDALDAAKRMQEATAEKQRNLELEQERLKSERKAFEDSKKEAETKLRKEEKRIRLAAEEFEKKVQKMKAEEVERRKKEESARVKRKEQDRRTEEEDEAELYTGNKQFSGGFLIGLLLLCAVVAGVLFAFPYLTQSGIF